MSLPRTSPPPDTEPERDESRPAPARPAGGRSFWRSTGGVTVLRLAVLVVLVGAWQIVAESGLLTPVLSKSPHEVAEFMAELVADGDLVEATGSTLYAVLLSFVIGSVTGIAAGVVLGLSPLTLRVLNPYLVAANSMPRVALAPLFIVAFGLGVTSKVAVAVTLVFFLALNNTIGGVRSADDELLRLSTALGATRASLVWKVILPSAVPSIFAALRLGLSFALLGVVAAELVASRQGLGQLVAQFAGQFRMEGVYGVILFLALIASVLNVGMTVAENRLLRWQPR